MTVGLGRPLQNAGAPVNGTNEVQRLTIGGTPTGGTFKLKFDGLTTGSITWSATNATLLANIQAALDALPNVGTNGIVAADVSLTAGIGALSLTFGARLAKLDVSAITVPTNALTGTSPTLVITTTTAGVTATGRGAPRGKKLIDTDTGIEYVNTSSNPLAPTWSQQEGTGSVATADIADAGVTKAKAAVFFSSEQTATGSAQNVAHGLGAVPAGVLVVPTEHPGTPDTGAFDIAEGTHTTTNVVVTVTANVKFKVFAWA
jgi:hypothetical protein